MPDILLYSGWSIQEDAKLQLIFPTRRRIRPAFVAFASYSSCLLHCIYTYIRFELGENSHRFELGENSHFFFYFSYAYTFLPFVHSRRLSLLFTIWSFGASGSYGAPGTTQALRHRKLLGFSALQSISYRVFMSDLSIASY